jgi:hypothetical protein
VPGARRDSRSLGSTVDRSRPQAPRTWTCAASSIFANPADDKTKVSFSPGERGSTDRSLFVFQKPR